MRIVLLHRGIGPCQERPELGAFLVRAVIRMRCDCSNLVAALWSEDWQKRKRTSLRDLVKAYLPDMVDRQLSIEGQSCGSLVRVLPFGSASVPHCKLVPEIKFTSG